MLSIYKNIINFFFNKKMIFKNSELSDSYFDKICNTYKIVFHQNVYVII